MPEEVSIAEQVAEELKVNISKFYSTNETVTGTAPKLFLDFRQTLKHFAADDTFERMSDL